MDLETGGSQAEGSLRVQVESKARQLPRSLAPKRAGLITTSRGAFELAPQGNRGINQSQIALGRPQMNARSAGVHLRMVWGRGVSV